MLHAVLCTSCTYYVQEKIKMWLQNIKCETSKYKSCILNVKCYIKVKKEKRQQTNATGCMRKANDPIY